jgi:DEAD/DEAH box helicase domain-containing protein
MRVIVFYIESRLWAEDLDPKDKEHGWELLRQGKGGASAIVLYDTRDRWLYAYDDHEVEACARHIEQADLLVGFNSVGFDLPVMEGLARRALRVRKHYDIFEALSGACAKRGIKTGKGDLTLDRISRRNLGRGKIEHGGNAKELARTGKFGKLFRYCGDDVHLTFDLFMKIVETDGLIGPGGYTRLPLPADFKRAT